MEKTIGIIGGNSMAQSTALIEALKNKDIDMVVVQEPIYDNSFELDGVRTTYRKGNSKRVRNIFEHF